MQCSWHIYLSSATFYLNTAHILKVQAELAGISHACPHRHIQTDTHKEFVLWQNSTDSNTEDHCPVDNPGGCESNLTVVLEHNKSSCLLVARASLQENASPKPVVQ